MEENMAEITKGTYSTERRRSFSAKGIVGIALSAAVLVIMNFIPGNESLQREGIMALCIMAVAIILWCCETFPVGITGLLAVILCVLFNVVDIGSAFTGFATSTTIFLIGIFSLTILMTKTGLGQRLTKRLVSWAGASSIKVILAFMIGATLISSIMTDTGATLIGISLAVPFLSALGHKPGSSNLGKCIMIAIPFCSVLGGFTTPVGHSLNVLGNGMLAAFSGAQVGFLDWMIIGVPIAVFMIPVVLFFLTVFLKPEKIEEKDIKAVLETTKDMGKFSLSEKKALIMILAIPLLWILGNWIPMLNPTIVIVIGVVIMFLPGVNLLTWEDMQTGVPWNIVIMVASILSLGSILSASGATDYIANLFLGSGILTFDPLIGILLVAGMLYILHTLIPAGPALITVFLPILFVFTETVGISPVIAMFVICLMVSGSFILPLNPTIGIAYAKGYFAFGDVARGGALSAVILVVVPTLWIYFMSGVLGM